MRNPWRVNSGWAMVDACLGGLVGLESRWRGCTGSWVLSRSPLMNGGSSETGFRKVPLHCPLLPLLTPPGVPSILASPGTPVLVPFLLLPQEQSAPPQTWVVPSKGGKEGALPSFFQLRLTVGCSMLCALLDRNQVTVQDWG